MESPAEIEKLKSAGVNPLVELGIMSEPGTTPTPTEETPAIHGPGVIAIVAMTGALMCVTRRKRRR